jgi:tetraacyldisaccharide 4'-kinase
VSNFLQSGWLRRGWVAVLLWPVSLAYGVLTALHRQLYRFRFLKTEQVAVPVVVVGNIVAGGGGKTPLVLALVAHLQGKGIATGVISRGYGRSGHDCLEVQPDMAAVQAGDEPVLIRRKTGVPVFVARRRADAARALLAAYPATRLLICDDGLQHHAIHRDMGIAVFDDRGLGNGWLLPAGPLRERWQGPRQHGIDLVLHTGTAPAFAGHVSSRSLEDHAVDEAGNHVSLDSLKHAPAAALAAIAHPEAFFGMLRAAGLTLVKTIALPDHDDFASLACPVPEGTTLLCTEKDAVKLFQAASDWPVRVLAVPLVFRPEAAFFEAFDRALAPLLSQLPLAHGHKTA